jgi:PTS system nitrogen regulatory IIA component
MVGATAIHRQGTHAQGAEPNRATLIDVELASSLERGVGLVEDGPIPLDDALARLAALGARTLGVGARELHEALRMRERIRPTALPGGVAIPHAIVRGLPQSLVIPMLVRHGVLFEPLEPPSTIIIGMFGNADQPWQHVKLLARLAKIAHDPGALAHIRAAIDPADLVMRLMERGAVHA